MKLISHVQPVICRSLDHDITIAFPLRRELRRTYRCRYECSLVKNLPTQWETEEENQLNQSMKNLLTQWGAEEENR